MNTEKLLNVLFILDEINDKDGLSEIFKELSTLISGTDANAIESKKAELYKILEHSTLNAIPYSDSQLIKRIGADVFFGRTAKQYLEKFFSTNGHLLKDNIQEYVTKRQTYIESIGVTATKLNELRFTPHFNETEYELGLTLPDKFKSLDEVAKAIQDWNLFLSYLAGINGEDTQIKISLVSEGSLSLFVIVSAAVAKSVNLFMAEIATFYEHIARIRNADLETRFLKSQVIREELKNKIEEERVKFISEATQALLKDIEADETTMNNHRSELSGRVKKVLVLTEKGVRLELVPPELNFEERGNGQEISKAEQKKIDQVNEVNIINERLTPIYVDLGKESLLLEDEIQPEEKVREDAQSEATPSQEKTTKDGLEVDKSQK